MGEIFGSIYCFLFEEWYGLDLASYLWGEASPQQTTNMFISCGLWMLAITLVFNVLYYFIIDHPKFAKWWGWSLFMLVGAFLTFVIGWQITLRDFDAGLMITADNKPLDVFPSDCFKFGIVNAILSMFFYCIFSAILKWRSTNSAHVPF